MGGEREEEDKEVAGASGKAWEFVRFRHYICGPDLSILAAGLHADLRGAPHRTRCAPASYCRGTTRYHSPFFAAVALRLRRCRSIRQWPLVH